MSAESSYRVIVLFEDELRVAARLLQGFFDESRQLTPEEMTGIVEACHCALQGAEDESACLVMGRKPDNSPGAAISSSNGTAK